MPWTAEPEIRTDKPDRSRVILVRPGDGRDPEKEPWADVGTRYSFSVAEARALAASLIAAADAVEPSAERSCFTCRFCPSDPGGDICEPHRADVEGVDPYVTRSGCSTSPDGMPTNRTLACPGWAAKEP